MRQLLVCISVIFLCGCAVGLNKSAREQISELNDNFKSSQVDLNNLITEIQDLNKNLVELKTLQPTLAPALEDLVTTMKRIADALEALDKKTSTSTP